MTTIEQNQLHRNDDQPAKELIGEKEKKQQQSGNASELERPGSDSNLSAAAILMTPPTSGVKRHPIISKLQPTIDFRHTFR